MRSISYTFARGNMAKTMKCVCENHDPVIITRNKSDAVVMVSLEDFEAMRESSYLLQSPANAHRLMESIGELNAGKGVMRELIK